MKGSERIRAAFAQGHTALIPYLTAGYPDLRRDRAVGEAFVEAGADILEIGVPFSDPLADGPTVQNTTAAALRNGSNLNHCLSLASGFSERLPVVLLVYYNNIFAVGTQRFLDEAVGAGVAGLVVPDLPLEEAGELYGMAGEREVALCPLVAPTSSDERIGRIGELASGFVYAVSVAGVTGVRGDLPEGATGLLRRVRSLVGAPVALGFGIGSAEAAREAAGEADGVIIGSKLMQLVGDEGVEAAGEWLAGVREALSGVRH